MNESNVLSIVPKAKGRKVGQRVQSLDLRAYKALMEFEFEGHDDKSDLVDAIIVHLRDREIF